MAELRGLVISLILISLFAISIISFAALFAQENNASDISTDPSINKAFGNLSKKLNESAAVAEARKQSMQEESRIPVISTVEFIFSSILDAGKTFIDMTLTSLSYFLILISEKLGISPIVTGTIVAIITITLILAAWRVYKAGE